MLTKYSVLLPNRPIVASIKIDNHIGIIHTDDGSRHYGSIVERQKFKKIKVFMARRNFFITGSYSSRKCADLYIINRITWNGVACASPPKIFYI